MSRLALHDVKVDSSPLEDQDLVFQILSGLPLQRAKRDVAQMFAEFGLAWTWKDLQTQVRSTLPFRCFKRRHVRWTPIWSYVPYIPDAALLRYHTAKKNENFEGFLVIWASYEQQPVHDPWLVGRVKGSSQHRLIEAPGLKTDQGLYVILASWD